MLGKQKILNIINDYCQGSDMFAVDVKISQQNKIKVFVDGDNDITISDCARLSKHIESFLNRDEEDFKLEVSSAGVGKPLKVFRQYKKNIGRNIVVETYDNDKIRGKLISAENDGVELLLLEKDIVDKGRQTAKNEIKSRFIKFEKIKEAKIKAAF